MVSTGGRAICTSDREAILNPLAASNCSDLGMHVCTIRIGRGGPEVFSPRDAGCSHRGGEDQQITV